MATTRAMFGTWKGFEREIRRMFGDIDEIKTAENHLYGLRQTSSTIAYATGAEVLVIIVSQQTPDALSIKCFCTRMDTNRLDGLVLPNAKNGRAVGSVSSNS